MLRTRSFDLVHKSLEYDNFKNPKLRASVGAGLQELAQDQAIRTDPEETRRRRTIRLHRNRAKSWGFTLQTYGIRNKKTREVEVMSYVDYVEINGPAWVAGMRRGDVILSVNGESVESSTHRELVGKVQRSGLDLRLVVLFEDCCKKVELHERYLKLKKMLSLKMRELRALEEEERRISQGVPLSRVDVFRQSTYSSCSSDWDTYSEITSPSVFDTIPVNQFVFRENLGQSVSDVSTLSSASSSGNPAPDSSFSQSSNAGDDDDEEISATDVESKEKQAKKNLHMRVQKIDSKEDEVFEDEKKMENGETGVVSVMNDMNAGKEEFVRSGESDVSQGSDGFRNLYNVTRCAQCISDVAHCPHSVPVILPEMSDSSFVSEGGSMTNLALKSGSGVVKVSVGQGQVQSSTREENGDDGESVVKQKVFYIESDSEDSVMSGDLRVGGRGHRSSSANSSAGSGKDAVIFESEGSGDTLNNSCDVVGTGGKGEAHSVSTGAESMSRNCSSSDSASSGAFKHGAADNHIYTTTNQEKDTAESRQSKGEAETSVSVEDGHKDYERVQSFMSITSWEEEAWNPMSCVVSQNKEDSVEQCGPSLETKNTPGEVNDMLPATDCRHVEHASHLPGKDNDSSTPTPHTIPTLELSDTACSAPLATSTPLAQTTHATQPEHGTERTDVTPKRRYIHGIYINESSHSTRL